MIAASSSTRSSGRIFASESDGEREREGEGGREGHG